MKDIITSLNSLNESFRKILTANDFNENFDKLSDEDKETLLRALNTSVNNAIILTNKLTKDGWKK